MATNDPVNLDELGWNYRAARAVQVANNLGLFTVLSEGDMTVEQISTRCHTRPDMTEKLLIACVAMGLMDKHGDKYKNTAYAQTYLVRGAKLYQGDIIAHSAAGWNFWHGLENEVRHEPAPKPDQALEHRNFILGMHNIAMAGRAELLADSVDLTGRKKLFDVGGGPGTYSIVLCRRYGELHAVVFDLPETIAIARQVIANEKVDDRVTVHEGDWNTDDFGDNNDVVLISNVLHGRTSHADMKLGKAYRSMIPGGLLLIQDFLLNDDKSGPLAPALFNIMVGAYSRPELFSVIQQAGFVDPKLRRGPEGFGNAIVSAKKP